MKRIAWSGSAIAVLLLLIMPQLLIAGELAYGSFTYLPKVDEFTDADRGAIATMDKAQKACLAWKCDEDGLNVLYLFGKYLGGDRDDEVLVRYRIDKHPPSERRYWNLTANHQMAYMPMNEVELFTKAALDGSALVIEVTDPLDGEVLRHEFSLRGLTAALNRLRCAGSH